MRSSLPLRLLKLPEVCGRRAKGVTAHYDDIKEGTFTPPVKLTPRSSAWPEHEVDAIIAATIAGKSGDELRELVQELVAARATLPAQIAAAA
jgi:prophage regulatory protein